MTLLEPSFATFSCATGFINNLGIPIFWDLIIGIKITRIMIFLIIPVINQIPENLVFTKKWFFFPSKRVSTSFSFHCPMINEFYFPSHPKSHMFLHDLVLFWTCPPLPLLISLSSICHWIMIFKVKPMTTGLPGQLTFQIPSKQIFRHDIVKYKSSKAFEKIVSLLSGRK